MQVWQAGNQLTVKSFRFSGGETQVAISGYTPDFPRLTIRCRLRSGDDVMELLLVVDALRQMGVSSSDIDLHLAYLPYARQDRVMVQGESFSLKVFSSLINNLQLNSVTVFDPHSDVGPALLDRCRVENNHRKVKWWLASVQPLWADVVLISPDAGAYKKTAKLAAELQLPVVVATKTRDVTTGALSAPHVLGDVQNKVCVIVDDICDGGRTFTQLADALSAAGARENLLFVSHGIFSNGYADLTQRFRSIGTTDSFSDTYPDFITVCPTNLV